MSKYIISMPEGWIPAMCPDCHIQYSDCNGICGETVCPLAKAQEVIEVDANAMQYYGEGNNGDIHNGEGWKVKLFATKEEAK